MPPKSKKPSKSKSKTKEVAEKKGGAAGKDKGGGAKGAKGPKGKGPAGKGNAKAGKAGKGKGGKGKKGKKGRKKKKGPRCPIKRRKKAAKRKCTDMLAPDAILNSYYTCHGVTDMLKFRKFKWKKSKK